MINYKWEEEEGLGFRVLGIDGHPERSEGSIFGQLIVEKRRKNHLLE